MAPPQAMESVCNIGRLEGPSLRGCLSYDPTTLASLACRGTEGDLCIEEWTCSLRLPFVGVQFMAPSKAHAYSGRDGCPEPLDPCGERLRTRNRAPTRVRTSAAHQVHGAA